MLQYQTWQKTGGMKIGSVSLDAVSFASRLSNACALIVEALTIVINDAMTAKTALSLLFSSSTRCQSRAHGQNVNAQERGVQKSLDIIIFQLWLQCSNPIDSQPDII